MHMFIVPWLYVTLSCFTQLSLNFSFILWTKQLNSGARLLHDVVKYLVISSDNHLDFHFEMSSVLLIFRKSLSFVVWDTKQFCKTSSSRWFLPWK